MSDDTPQTAWIRRAQAGSAGDFARLVAAHQQALRMFLRRLCADPAEADDIAQDTFLFAWGAMARFDPARPFRPWLFAIAWRKVRESRRSWLRRRVRENEAATGEESAPDPDTRLDLTAALARLAPAQRAAVLLCLAHGFSHSDAAAVLEMPLGTVKSHVARARETLRAALGDGHDG